jgi:hypothetical protein
MRWRCGDPDSGVLCKPKSGGAILKDPPFIRAGRGQAPSQSARHVSSHRCGSCRVHLPSICPQIAFHPWWKLDRSSIHGLGVFPGSSISTISQTGCSISRLVPSLSAHRDVFDSPATPHFDHPLHNRTAQDAATGRWSSINDPVPISGTHLSLPARLPGGSSARPGKELLQTVRAPDSRS